MAKAIMVQGTASNAGKSLLAAALCRILRQDGYRVAPFKSQNMALNSFITKEGLEMGRAQVMQAEAAGMEPSVLMNPILLKPSSDTGSQVIVLGEVVGAMPAREYFQYKASLIPIIRHAYETLASQVDVVVIEGAGSPAEINLKENDIVNMGMAQMADAPVLLVADIDRGGVFASLAGTLLLLEPDERDRVEGLVINKFRGDRAILEPGIRQIEAITQKPVVGVLPFLDVDLDDEDSLSERLTAQGTPGLVEVAVIRLPRLSNFTDFAPLERIQGLSLRYVSSLRALGSPDLIILPGTKNTMEDLLWLRQSGLEAAIQKHAAAGGLVLGICGGYQMLGRSLSDPLSVEHGGSMAGMGLLPVETVFADEKTRTQVKGKVRPLTGPYAALSGAPVSGYEIHMGQTVAEDPAEPVLELKETTGLLNVFRDGYCKDNVLGCYIHGLLDDREFCNQLVSLLFTRKGVDWQGELPDLDTYKELQYDRLAEQVRANLDMPAIYRMLKGEE